MSEQDDSKRRKDAERSKDEGFSLGRRDALKGGAAGLGLLTLGGLSASPAAAHTPANRVGAAGSVMAAVETTSGPASNRTSQIHTLLGEDTDGNTDARGESNTSGTGKLEFKVSDKQDLVVQPTIQCSLQTDVKVNGNDTISTAKAGILGWVELNGPSTSGWDMVTVDGSLVDAPQSADELIDSNGDLAISGQERKGVVAFNNRAFKLETNLADLDDDEFIALYLKTNSSHGFNQFAVDLASGTYEMKFKGVVHVYVDDDKATAEAIAGPRTLYTEPVKLPHGVNGHD